jgi:hypothetical protein
MTGTLALYDAAKAALAKAVKADEVKAIHDKAKAIKAAAKIAGDKSMEADAAEIRARAERRLGEMMAAQPKAKPPNPKRRVIKKPDDPLTLDEAGIDKNLAHRARSAWGMSEKDFADEVESLREQILSGWRSAPLARYPETPEQQAERKAEEREQRKRRKKESAKERIEEAEREAKLAAKWAAEEAAEEAAAAKAEQAEPDEVKPRPAPAAKPAELNVKRLEKEFRAFVSRWLETENRRAVLSTLQSLLGVLAIETAPTAEERGALTEAMFSCGGESCGGDAQPKPARITDSNVQTDEERRALNAALDK